MVENDVAVREYVVVQFEAAGYVVRQTKDGPSALAILAADTSIELLFTGVMMPGGMTGRELAIAALGLRPDLKMVYTSGYTENAIVLISLLDRDRQWFKSRQGLDITETTRDIAFCHKTLEHDELMVDPDTQTHPLFRDYTGVVGAPASMPDDHSICPAAKKSATSAWSTSGPGPSRE